MAKFKYFADIGGESVELVSVFSLPNKWFDECFPNVKALRNDGYSKRCGHASDGRILPMTRAIEMKRNPSKHVCNARCINGKPNGACECQCGGARHGVGMFTNLLAA